MPRPIIGLSADLVENHRAVIGDVTDLGAPGLDQGEGDGLLALAHQHLAGLGP